LLSKDTEEDAREVLDFIWETESSERARRSRRELKVESSAEREDKEEVREARIWV
tara:strand:+ start:1272 stop:1436 length:165 start_codon:yes stop_codon:yes gene_type:complete